MTGLIEEIQRDASDDSASVTQLLRRVKIAATKLHLGCVEEWVEHELEGYPDKAELPGYRVLGGVALAHSVYHGWRLMALSQDQRANMVFTVNLFRAAVSEVELHATGTGLIILSYPEWLERMTLPHMHLVDKIGMQLDQGKFRALLNGVRNRCLDWALKLERAGVTGEGLSFSNTEMEAAKSVSYNFYGDNSRVNNHSVDNSLNQVSHGDVFDRLHTQISQNIDDAAQRDELLSAVAEMRNESVGDGFGKAYAKFMGLAADHIGVLQWAIPLLTAYLTTKG